MVAAIHSPSYYRLWFELGVVTVANGRRHGVSVAARRGDHRTRRGDCCASRGDWFQQKWLIVAARRPQTLFVLAAALGAPWQPGTKYVAKR